VFKNFYCSILNRKLLTAWLQNCVKSLNLRLKNFLALTLPYSPVGINRSGEDAYSTKVYIRLWTVSIVLHWRKKYIFLRKSDLFPSSRGKDVEQPIQLCPLERSKFNTWRNEMLGSVQNVEWWTTSRVLTPLSAPARHRAPGPRGALGLQLRQTDGSHMRVEADATVTQCPYLNEADVVTVGSHCNRQFTVSAKKDYCRSVQTHSSLMGKDQVILPETWILKFSAPIPVKVKVHVITCHYPLGD